MAKCVATDIIRSTLNGNVRWIYSDKRKDGWRRYKVIGSIRQQEAEEIAKQLAEEDFHVRCEKYEGDASCRFGEGWLFFVKPFNLLVTPDEQERQAKLAASRAKRAEELRQHKAEHNRKMALIPCDAIGRKYYRDATVAYIKDNKIEIDTVELIFGDKVILEGSGEELLNPSTARIVT